METNTITEVLNKLIGSTRAIGSTHVDDEINKNLTKNDEKGT